MADLDRDPVPVLEDALERCLDALEGTAIRSGGRAGWLSWELDGAAEPVRMLGGRPALYDGDAGVAWALAGLADFTGRSDLRELGRAALRNAGAVPLPDSFPPGPGLLDGAAGVLLAAGALGVAVPDGPAVATCTGSDLTSGLAGVLLAQVRSGTCGPSTGEAVALLRDRALPTPLGVCWSEPSVDDPAGRPLCGLAHGNSGIALALAEAAVAHPSCAREAAPLAAEALRWEAAWFDPVVGGWPDLRSEPPAFPALWCHGAAGIAVVRLRLLELTAAGLDLGFPVEALRAEAEAAVGACGADVARAVAHPGPPPGGLTLCHGLGGPLEALVLASEVWGVPGHLEAARHYAAAAVERMGEDPLAWPAGIRAGGSAALFVGVSGAALVLARLLEPARVPSPALLGPVGGSHQERGSE